MTSDRPDPAAQEDPGQPSRPMFRIGSETQIVDTTVKGGDREERPARAVQQWDPVAGEPEHASDQFQELEQSRPQESEQSNAREPEQTNVDAPGPPLTASLPSVAVVEDKPVWSWPTSPPGSTTVLPATAPAHGAPASTVVVTEAAPTAVAPGDTTTVDTRAYARRHRLERRVMILSTLLGTLGLAVAFAAAGLDQLRYDQPGPCATYATAHKGQTGFGCSTTAKHVAVVLPVVGIVALVLAALAAVWIPQRTPRGRLAWLGGYVVLLALCAVAVALALSALPQN